MNPILKFHLKVSTHTVPVMLLVMVVLATGSIWAVLLGLLISARAWVLSDEWAEQAVEEEENRNR